MELTYEDDSNPGLFYSFGRGEPNGTLLVCQLVSMLFIIGWTLATMMPFFWYMNYKGWLRSDSYEEIIGLDVSYHGGGMRLSVEDGSGIQFVEARRQGLTHLNDGSTGCTDKLESGPSTANTDQSGGGEDPIRGACDVEEAQQRHSIRTKEEEVRRNLNLQNTSIQIEEPSSLLLESAVFQA